MNNANIADTFDLVADLLEFQGANPFRVRAYRSGAATIRDLPESIASLLNDEHSDLTQIPGIGKDLAAKCEELVNTGHLEMLDELRLQIPESVLQLMRIPGLGPKKAAALYNELGIVELDQLRDACESGKVRQLKGFGAKTEAAILEGIVFAATTIQRMRWADVDAFVQTLIAYLKSDSTVQRVEAAGSYRRKKETVGDLDILVVASDGSQIMDRLAAFANTEKVLARGDTKMSVRARNGLQIDLRVVPQESFGAALQYFTGSKDHNVILRGRAKQRNLKINEYGVYDTSDGGEVYVAGKSEADVYRTLGLPCFPPELREARHEFAWADAGTLPILIDDADLVADLHMHTSATDGKASLREMAEAARQRGHRYIAITDHSPRVTMANGLNPQRLRAQWGEIDALNQEFAPDFQILKGIECDILEAGGMDLPDDVLAEADWVIASVHYGQNQSQQQITDRIVGAIEHPSVSAIAHPTGRLINRRAPYEVDMEAVFRAAAKYRKLLELNANPYRLDLNDVHCAAAKEHGILVVINSDAHSREGMEVMRFGVYQARRAGLTARDVANTRPWHELRACIGAQPR